MPPRARFTFASFVRDDDNEFAFRAACAVAAVPGGAYNPLLIYGGPEAEMKHLLYAAAGRLLGSRPRRKVEIVSGEFLAGAFDAVGARRTFGALHATLSAADALLVEHVDGLLPCPAAARAFAGFIKRLHRRRVQMILTSGLPPTRLGPIHGAVRSLEWAMTVRIGRRPRSRPNPRRSAT